MIKRILQLSLIILIIGCNSRNSNRTSSNNDNSSYRIDSSVGLSASSKSVDSIQNKFSLPDSLFKFMHLESTAFLRKISIESLTELDSVKKRILIKPFIPFFKDRLDYWDARFISKQEKIGDIQPIIIYLLTTDYLAIWYMTLTQDLQPISKYIIGSHGHYSETILSETDTTITYDTIKYCNFNDNKIFLHAINATMSRNKTNFYLGDSTKMASMDSTNFIIEVDPNGSFHLLNQEKFKYQRFFKYQETLEYARYRTRK